jgi:hypothetical protein
VLHPVGPLPAAIYWRRRALVLTLLLSLCGGGGWLGYALHSRPAGAATTLVAASTAPLRPAPSPALERVTPAVADVLLPPRYGRCADAVIAVRVTAPPTVPAGTPATFGLVVTNTSTSPCLRALDRGLQEVALLDAAGTRVWDSNDCVPLTGSDDRTLTPRQPVSLPMRWNGLTSDPHCAAPPSPPAPGTYVLRARLDTVVAPGIPLSLG